MSAVYVWDDRVVFLYNVFSDGVAVTDITIGAEIVDEEFGAHLEDTKVRQIQQSHVVFAELSYVPEPLLYLQVHAFFLAWSQNVRLLTSVPSVRIGQEEP